MTLLNDHALTTFDRLSITAKTKQNYRGAYRRYILPSLGASELSAITRAHIQDLLRGLPPQTGYQVLMVMKTLLREAVEAGELEYSPASRVSAPRVMVQPKEFLRWEQIVEHHFGRYDEQVRFLALHGLRWGEAAALTEADIHDGRVFITKSIHGTPKSAAGMRTVPYLGHFARFSHDRRGLARALRPYGVTIHSLRHTYAYLLKTSGVHITTAQKLLGHASPTLTLAIYTAVLDEEIDNAGEQIRLRTRAC